MDRTDRYTHKRISNEKLPIPPQHRTALEVPTALNHLGLAPNFFDRNDAPDKPPHMILILSVQPHLIAYAHVHRAPEHTRPFQMRRVEMRMADHDCL